MKSVNNSKHTKENKETFRKQLGQNLKYKRKYNKLTLDEIAEYLGLTSSYLGMVERGTRGLGVFDILKLSNLYGCTTDDLIKDINPENKTEANSVNINMILETLKFNSEEDVNLLVNIIKVLNNYMKEKQPVENNAFS